MTVIKLYIILFVINVVY